MMTLKTYILGVAWFLLHIICGATNDIISKFLSSSLNSFEIAFFRFIFSAIGVLPFVIYQGKSALKTSNFFIHIIRGILLFGAMTAWIYGLSMINVTTATVIGFSIPIFNLSLAAIFLNERISWQRFCATIFGFIGVAITLYPYLKEFHTQILVTVLSAMSFAALDIINKKFVQEESLTSMKFYSCAITAILSIPPAVAYWKMPAWQDLALLFFLGAISANLMLFFLLKAFSLIDATSVGPYRYLEILISFAGSYFVFNQIPPQSTWYGGIIIILSACFILYADTKNKDLRQ